jgi:signal transduction histidine kinase
VLGVLCGFAVLFVGTEVIERHLFPTMSIAVRHAFLTLRAGVVTVIVSATVYYLMRRQQRRLSQTAAQLTQLLESYQENPSAPGRFENPHLVHCRDVFNCDAPDCPMYDARGERCWQVMALRHPARDPAEVGMAIQHCHECDAYRLSCPDKLTELGESFNNVMYLLEQGAGQIGRMRAQMIEKQKMAAIGQIAAGVAHEVCNPLSSISSVVQMLKREGAYASNGKQLELIEKHIQRITSVVRQLINLARPGSLPWESVDVGEMLRDAVRLVQFDPRARNVDVRVEAPANGLHTYARRGQLQQVVLNLALNSLDAMSDGGTMTLSAEAQQDEISIRVRDTGCGIADHVGRRVFEPFFTTKDPGRGTGLGLAMAYGIVQEHGGTIDYNSEPGKGSVFTVQVPIRDRAPDG